MGDRKVYLHYLPCFSNAHVFFDVLFASDPSPLLFLATNFFLGVMVLLKKRPL